MIGGYKMTIQDNTVIQPIPSDELLAEKERKWKLVFEPVTYKVANTFSEFVQMLV